MLQWVTLFLLLPTIASALDCDRLPLSRKTVDSYDLIAKAKAETFSLVDKQPHLESMKQYGVYTIRIEHLWKGKTLEMIELWNNVYWDEIPLGKPLLLLANRKKDKPTAYTTDDCGGVMPFDSKRVETDVEWLNKNLRNKNE